MINRLKLWTGLLGLAVLYFFASAAEAQPVPQREMAPAPVTPVPVMSRPANIAAPVPQGAPAAIIDVPLNRAKVYTLPVPVGSIVIANEAIANVHFEPTQPTKMFLISRDVGSTNIFFMNPAGDTISHIVVRVLLDAKAVQDAIHRLLPEENIKVTVYRNSIYLTGAVRSATAATSAQAIAERFFSDGPAGGGAAGGGAAAGGAAPAGGGGGGGLTVNVVNMLTILASQQVVLKVQVSEMARTIIKNLQVEQGFDLGLTGDKRLTFTNAAVAAIGGQTASLSAVLNTTLPGLAATSISALERQGLVKTLAEPTLTARSGETATFLSGGEFPYPNGQDENGDFTFAFREFGVRLNFTPKVLNEGRISLQITTEISSLDTANQITIGNAVINGLATKRTETTVDLQSGGSLMISGLLQDNLTNQVDGFPGLKNIPVLGTLFRSTSYQRGETELVVTVAAYMVKPVGGKNARLAVPTDGFEEASDLDYYLLGKLHREYVKGDLPAWARTLKGPFGYIMK
ncbi:MAG: type II and III secretion system protein family protein [Rhodospirillales bacterium]|nr:type II and III secretion system protein family protein [Rhodospirillaceae bacterium]MBT8001661.1 type II and III secretion system protein family protein [Rhodospirillales bacterium]